MDGRRFNGKALKWTPELQEKKRQTFYGTRAAWIKDGRPRIRQKLKVPEELPKSYREAKKVGAKFYFTGVPCQNGHITVRKVDDRHCYECNRQRQHGCGQPRVKMPPVLEPVPYVPDWPYRTIVL